MERRIARLVLAAMLAAVPAGATDVPVVGLKLIVVDKGMNGGKVVFVAKDTAVDKGMGEDPAMIQSTVEIAYDGQGGVFTNPPGASWVVNKATVAKYVNKPAPAGGATKVSVIKPGILLKNVGKSLGDLPIDISSPPTGDVDVVFTVKNGGETVRHCTTFDGPTCAHKSIAGGTGWKLVCKGNATAAACPPVASPYCNEGGGSGACPYAGETCYDLASGIIGAFTGLTGFKCLVGSGAEPPESLSCTADCAANDPCVDTSAACGVSGFNLCVGPELCDCATGSGCSSGTCGPAPGAPGFCGCF